MRVSFCFLVEGWDLIHVLLFLPLILAPAWPRARWEGIPWSPSLSVPSHPETEGSLLGQMFLSPSKKEKKERLLSGLAIFIGTYELSSEYLEWVNMAYAQNGGCHAPGKAQDWAHSHHDAHTQHVQVVSATETNIFPINFTRSEHFLLWFYVTGIS